MSDGPICVDIVHSEGKIGDTLCVVPLILQLAELAGTEVHVIGAFAEPVKALTQRLPIRFGVPDGEDAINIRLDVSRAYAQGRLLNLHMVASLCRIASVPVPRLPVALDLVTVSVVLPPGIVLSPFSGSPDPWYKIWPLSHWLGLTRHLAASQDLPVYVMGAGGEAADRFADAGAIPLMGLPLPAVLQVMRDAAMFVSIDNGLSHLAHFGTVKQHLLIYPEMLPPRLVVNPWARVLRERAKNISVERVIGHVEEMMRERVGDRVMEGFQHRA